MIPGRRNPRRTVFTLLAVLVLGVAAFQVFKRPAIRIFGDFMRPYLSIPAGAEALVNASADEFKSVDELRAELVRLRNENESLQVANSELKTLRQQHLALRKMMSLPPIYGYRYVRGQVILRDPAGWDTTFTVGVGEKDGVHAGYPVLASVRNSSDPRAHEQLAVVGRVSEVTARTAAVQTLLHPESNLSVFMPGSKTAAILRGGRMIGTSAILEMCYIPRTRTLSEFEEVCTSGFSPMTPEGLHVGTVTRNSDGELLGSENQLDFTGKVKMSADISTLRFVVIPVPGREPAPTPEAF